MALDARGLNGSGNLLPELFQPPAPDHEVARSRSESSREKQARQLDPDPGQSLFAFQPFASPKGREVEVTVPKGIIDPFLNTTKRWRLKRDEQLTLLGFGKAKLVGDQVLAGRIAPSSQDIEDRVGYVVGISLGLGALFGEVVDAETAWLGRPRTDLDGKSALAFMLEGHMANLIAVSQLVIRERGL